VVLADVAAALVDRVVAAVVPVVKGAVADAAGAVAVVNVRTPTFKTG